MIEVRLNAQLTGMADHPRRDSTTSTGEEAKRVNYGPFRGCSTTLSHSRSLTSARFLRLSTRSGSNYQYEIEGTGLSLQVHSSIYTIQNHHWSTSDHSYIACSPLRRGSHSSNNLLD